MYSFPNSVRSHTKGKTVNEIANDPHLGPFFENIAPLSNTVRNLTRRVKQKTLGKGTFGRVNLETLSNGRSQVATKYFVNNEDFEQNLSEIITLNYLKGYPNVAQYVGISSKNADGTNLPFPALVMAKAQSSLVGTNVNRSWPMLRQTIRDILHGYYVLHSLGIAHRDTKPDNMLRTAYGETWITDFGKSRYVANHIPLLDGYMGTPLFCSPELLMISLLQQLKDNTIPDFNCNWYAHDCWAVGVSILEILTDLPYFEGNGRRELLHNMFHKKGTPSPEDGVTFRPLYQMFQKYYGEIRSIRKPFSNTLGMFLDSAMHVDIPPEEHASLVTMLHGFLTYDPVKRWTIRQALEFLGEHPAPIPRPLSYANVSIPNSPTHMERIVQTLYMHCSIPADDGFMISRKSKYIVLDRACAYIFLYLANHEVKSESKEIVALAITSLILASCLLNGYGSGYRLDFIKEYGIPETSAIEYMQEFVQLDMPLYGRTILDTMIEHVRPYSPLVQKQCGLLNLLCFQHMLYGSYRDRISELVEVCARIVTNPQSSLRTELSEKDYDHPDLFQKRGTLERIVQDIRNGMGDRNANVTQALRQVEFAKMSNKDRDQYVQNFVKTRSRRRVAH